MLIGSPSSDSVGVGEHERAECVEIESVEMARLTFLKGREAAFAPFLTALATEAALREMMLDERDFSEESSAFFFGIVKIGEWEILTFSLRSRSLL